MGAHGIMSLKLLKEGACNLEVNAHRPRCKAFKKFQETGDLDCAGLPDCSAAKEVLREIKGFNKTDCQDVTGGAASKKACIYMAKEKFGIRMNSAGKPFSIFNDFLIYAGPGCVLFYLFMKWSMQMTTEAKKKSPYKYCWLAFISVVLILTGLDSTVPFFSGIPEGKVM